MSSTPSEKVEDDVALDPVLDSEALLGTSDWRVDVELRWQRPHHYLRRFGKHIVKAAAYTFLPSCLQRSEHRSVPQNKSNQSFAALDGLRGIACLIVVNQHFTYNFTEMIFAGWGTSPEAHYIIHLPFFSLLFNGQAMVSVFFVISGFVLSNRPLKLARAKQWDKLLDNMASAAFRRVVRLYLPVAASLFLITVMTWAGLFEPARAVKESDILTGNEDVPHRYETFGRQLWEWWLNVWLQIHPVMGSSTLDFHMWTLPVELRTSFTLFLTLVALSKLTYFWRTVVALTLILWCIWLRRDTQTMFYSGMLLADLDQHLAGAQEGPTMSGGSSIPTDKLKRANVGHIVMFVVGLYCLSTSYGDLSGPFYEPLRALNPPSFGTDGAWLKIVGATITTFTMKRYGLLQPLCTNAFAQYLGKVSKPHLDPDAKLTYTGQISYALYLCHGMVIRSWGYSVIPYMYRISGGRETDVGFGLAWILTAVAVFPVIFWVSDVFCRLVDMPSVTFGRWLEAKMRAV